MKLKELLAEGALMFETKDGRAVLRETYVELSKLDDDDLRAARVGFLKFYSAEFTAWQAMGDDRYATPEGVTSRRNMDYYDGLIRRIEYDMACRMITL